MKVGDLVKYKSEYVSRQLSGFVLAVGYGGHYTDTEQSPALHPDIWVLSSEGERVRWNEQFLEVVSESR
jgi:hypothetical protein